MRSRAPGAAGHSGNQLISFSFGRTSVFVKIISKGKQSSYFDASVGQQRVWPHSPLNVDVLQYFLRFHPLQSSICKVPICPPYPFFFNQSVSDLLFFLPFLSLFLSLFFPISSSFLSSRVYSFRDSFFFYSPPLSHFLFFACTSSIMYFSLSLCQFHLIRCVLASL